MDTANSTPFGWYVVEPDRYYGVHANGIEAGEELYLRLADLEAVTALEWVVPALAKVDLEALDFTPREEWHPKLNRLVRKAVVHQHVLPFRLVAGQRKETIHGTLNMLRKQNCKCERCKASSTAWQIAWRAHRRELERTGDAPDSAPHGTASRYTYGCKCAACRKAGIEASGGQGRMYKHDDTGDYERLTDGYGHPYDFTYDFPVGKIIYATREPEFQLEAGGWRSRVHEQFNAPEDEPFSALALMNGDAEATYERAQQIARIARREEAAVKRSKGKATNFEAKKERLMTDLRAWALTHDGHGPRQKDAPALYQRAWHMGLNWRAFIAEAGLKPPIDGRGKTRKPKPESRDWIKRGLTQHQAWLESHKPLAPL